MKCLRILGAGVILSGMIICSTAYAEEAKAELKNVQGEVVGNAVLSDILDGVKVSLTINKLTAGPAVFPGLHGFHIHSVGKCEPPDFASAGPHFNPTNKKHGHLNKEGAHAGDLPNVMVGTDGKGKLEAIAKGVTLGKGPNSLLGPEGSSLVIHANIDDDMTDPSGNSGARIACGVVTQ